ncbi:MAG: hypothetical protein WC614_04625 [bacterium]
MNEANNQGKGGGPKDTTNTRLNAVKHGIFTNRIFLSDEEREEFSKLKEDIISTLHPTDAFESILVDRICLYILRLQRCARADSDIDSLHGFHKSVRPRLALSKEEKHRIQEYERSAERSMFHTYNELKEHRKGSEDK